METDWTCKRCHHQSATKGNLVSHLSRKTPCEVEFTDISIEAYLKELTTKVFTGKVYECKHCKAQFSTRQAKFKHKSYCKVLKKQTKALTSGASTSETTTNEISTSETTTNEAQTSETLTTEAIIEDKIASLEAENKSLKQRLDCVEQFIMISSLQGLSTTKTITQINDNENMFSTNYILHDIVARMEQIEKTMGMASGASTSISNKPSVPTKKCKIPNSRRIATWNAHIGIEVGQAKCMCCQVNLITQHKFTCAHIVSDSHGATIEVSNLRPVCDACNNDMGNENLRDFAARIYKVNVV